MNLGIDDIVDPDLFVAMIDAHAASNKVGDFSAARFNAAIHDVIDEHVSCDQRDHYAQRMITRAAALLRLTQHRNCRAWVRQAGPWLSFNSAFVRCAATSPLVIDRKGRWSFDPTIFVQDVLATGKTCGSA